MFEARDLDSCHCGARWADDDLARCPGCGRDLDVEITITFDEASQAYCLPKSLLLQGERAVWRSSAETWSIVDRDGEESVCNPWACEWFDRIDQKIREEAEGC